jgi:hypothetical protein
MWLNEFKIGWLVGAHRCQCKQIVVEKAMKNDHLMSQPIVVPQYPHFTDKKIMKLRQSGDLNEGILKVFLHVS